MNNFNLTSILSNKKIMKIVVISAFLGIALIALSELIPEKTHKSEEETAKSSFVYDIEKEIVELVCAITGESEPTVMLTINASEKNIYAKEVKEQEDTSEEKYIIVKNSDGDEEALILTEIQPEIKGIVVASRYADDFLMKEKILYAVSTVLDLPSNKVCVVTKNK